jgi:chondroitin 4-sulfotransferase 11
MLTRAIQTNPKSYEKLKSQCKSLLPFSSRVKRKLSNAVSSIHQLYWEDYVFIHIPKCGGTSVERALGIPLLNHDTALERFKKIGPVRWTNRCRFTVVRNPYHRLASLFFYWEGTKIDPSENLQDRFASWLKRVERLFSDQHPNKHVLPQTWWISDQNGNSMIDIICKLESIDCDIQKVGKRLGRELRVHRIKANNTAINYDDLYNDESKAMVLRLYADDFERFGYDAQRC